MMSASDERDGGDSSGVEIELPFGGWCPHLGEKSIHSLPYLRQFGDLVVDIGDPANGAVNSAYCS